MLNNGVSYSLLGTYDVEAGLYRVELSGIINGWNVAVVEDPSVSIIRIPWREDRRGASSRFPMAWLTSQDWETFEWVVVNHTDMTADDVEVIILPELWGASETLAYAGFRSPKIYIDPRNDPPARVCHLIDSNHPDGSHFHTGYVEFDDGSWTYIEDQESYSTILRDHDELSALGQIYVNYDQFLTLSQDYSVTLGNIVIHELFHAVQYGYDVRKLRGSMRAYLEGTATPLGQTYQDTGSVTGPSVSVRVLRPNEHARLYQAVDDPGSPLHYTKQDFFGYISKRYGGNSFAWTDQLFEYMSIRTANRFGLTADQYRTLYREAMDEVFTERFGKSLSVIYREYALDRAYEHNPDYVLRPDEETPAKGFGPNQLAQTLFQWNSTDTKGYKEFDPATTNSVFFNLIQPLSSVAFSVDLPGQADPEDPADFPLLVSLHNGEVMPQSDRGIKIFAFLEDAEGTMVPEGRYEITDISDVVMIPYHEGAESVTILVMNCYVEARSASITLRAAPYIASISPNPAEPGADVTVRGVGIGGGKVYLNNEEMTEILAWGMSMIVFRLPEDAESGKVKVVRSGMESNEVLLNVEIVEPDPRSFNFEREWDINHTNMQAGQELIYFKATVDGLVEAINPQITIRDFINPGGIMWKSVQIKAENMRRNEMVTVSGTIDMDLSAYTVEPENPPGTFDGPNKWIYSYNHNPRLVAYAENENFEYVKIAEFSGREFSLDFHEESVGMKNFWKVDLYVEYDVNIKDHLGNSWNSINQVLRLELVIVKTVPIWQDP